MDVRASLLRHVSPAAVSIRRVEAHAPLNVPVGSAADNSPPDDDIDEILFGTSEGDVEPIPPMPVFESSPEPNANAHTGADVRFLIAVTVRQMAKRGAAACLFPRTANVRAVHDGCYSLWQWRFGVKLDGVDCADDLYISRLDPSNYHSSALRIHPMHSLLVVEDDPTPALAGPSSMVDVDVFNVLTSHARTITIRRHALVAALVRLISME